MSRIRALPANQSFGALFDPKPDYPYFHGAGTHPFRADATTFDLVNASYMADLALLAYLPPDAVQQKLRAGRMERVEEGFSSAGRGGVLRGGTQGFVAWGRGFAVVVFRGTEVSELRDVAADLDTVAVRGRGYHGRVHRGFRNALEEVWPNVEKQVGEALRSAGASEKSAPTLWLTGHSLGAALATIASSRLEGSQTVYTFGSPRVGDEEYARFYEESHYRIVNQNDVVTLVPTSPFEHVGHFYYIAEGRNGETGPIHDSPKLWTQLQDRLDGVLRSAQHWAEDLTQPLMPDHLADHSPLHYATKVWNEFWRRHGDGRG